MMNVLFVSFESLPFVKTGGLADVVAALPKALDKEKYNVKTVLPLLKAIKDKYYDKLEYLDHIYINSGVIHEEANIYRYFHDGLEYLFIENDEDIKNFLAKKPESKTLLSLTDGVHYHTIEAKSEAMLDVIEGALDKKGYLAK